MTHTESAIAPTRVRLSTPSDIALSVPYLLGFEPHESVVIVTLHGPKKRAGLTLRFDLLDAKYDADIVKMLAGQVRQAGPREVYILIYTDEPDRVAADGRRDLVRRAFVKKLRRAIRAEVQDALLIRDGRWWSYVCGDPRCCPPEGGLLDRQSPDAVALAAAHALHGNTVLPDRDAVVASLAPIRGIAGVAVEQAVERCSPLIANMTTQQRQERVTAIADDAIERFADPRATLTPDEVALLGLGCHDVLARDQVIGRCGDIARLDQTKRMLRDLARRCPPEIAAPAWGMFGWAAYCDGSGVEVWTAIEKARYADPTYSLVTLLEECMGRQIHPKQMREHCAIFAQGVPR